MPKKPAHFVGHSGLVVSFVIRHSTFVIPSVRVIRGQPPFSDQEFRVLGEADVAAFLASQLAHSGGMWPARINS
jgi:hypothetical protein